MLVLLVVLGLLCWSAAVGICLVLAAALWLDGKKM